MLIDSFTVAAQIINFLILVWLLKRYLYKPILKALEEREERIALQLKEAAKMKADAQNEKEKFQRKNDLFDMQAKEQTARIAAESAAEKSRLFDELRKEHEAIRSKYMESLLNEHKSLNKEISEKIQEKVFALARKTLSELADTNLEESIIHVFIQKLNKLEKSEKEKLQKAFASSDGLAVIVSSFGFSSSEKANMESAVNTALTGKFKYRYETSPDIVSGIELIVDGYKLSWNISDYIFSLENDLGNMIGKRTKI